MRLNTCSCVGKVEAKFFSRAFDLLCKRLGIDGYDYSVNLHFGYDSIGGPSAGSIVPSDKYENFDRIRAGKQPRDFDLFLEEAHPGEMLATFCHEMKHLQQWATGVLAAAIGKHGEPQQLYQGVIVDKDKIPYLDRPWEQEANAVMHVLAVWVLTQMDKELAVEPERRRAA